MNRANYAFPQIKLKAAIPSLIPFNATVRVVVCKPYSYHTDFHAKPNSASKIWLKPLPNCYLAADWGSTDGGKTLYLEV